MYVPSNAVVCAAGDFDGAVVLAKLEAAFGKWDGPHAPAVAVPEASPLVSDQVVVQELGTKLEPATVLIGYPSCQLGNPDLYAMDVLAGILGAGDSSRLGADLKVKRNLVYGITSYNQTPSWPGGIFGVHFTCDPDKVDEVRQAVAAHLAEFCRAAPSKEEVEKVKKQTIAELVMGNRTAAAQARTLSGDQLQIDDPFFSIKYVQNIQAVEPQDILRVARQYLQNAHSVTAIVRPKAAPAQAAGPQAEAGLKTTTTRVTFQDSGLTLLVYRTPGQPAVSMIATMKAGQTFETAENAGISAMAAEYLTRGTSRMDEGQIAGFFDAIGGSIAARSGWNSIYVESTVLKEDFAKAVKVFADVVAHPAFAPPLLQSTQARQLAALRAAQGNPVGECSMHFDEQFFTGSPYRFPMMGTEETIQKQTAEAVRDFYKAHAVGRNMVVAIAGDIDAGAAEQLVRAEFAGLPAGVAWQPPTGLPARTIENQEIYIYKTDKPSCVVMVGYPGLDLSNLRDRYPMDVFDTIISGYSTPRGLLHEVLRGQSLVYMVQFGGRPGLLPGYFKSIALCQSEKATLVARLLEDLVWSSRDKTFSAEELSNAKSIILTARQMDRQTPESVALEMALDELYGLGYDFEEKFAKGIGSVTADDVKRASSAIINKPIIVIATPKPELVDRAELQRAFDAKKLEDMKAKTPEHVPAAQPKHLDTK
jgi:zinc protease